MKFNLAKVKYSQLPVDLKTAEDLGKYIIGEAMQRRYPQGMPRTESRIYAKIQDQMYGDSKEIDLSDEGRVLLAETLDQVSLPPHFSSWKWTLLAALEALEAKEKK